MIRRTKIKRRKKASSRKRLIARLDADARQRVMDRDRETCQRAGESECSGPIQWSHVLSRIYLCVRWEEENALAMCMGHHHWWHMHSGQAMLWFTEKWPERWEHLRRIMASGKKYSDADLREMAAKLSG